MIENTPIGLVPRRIRWRQRVDEILLAMIRYSNVSKPVPTEWVEELQCLLSDGELE